MPMTPEELNITDVVNFVWSTTLDLHVEPMAKIPSASTSQPAMEAQVHIAGDWQGVVVLHAAPSLVANVAQRMFSLGDQPPTLDDMQDAFGEVANITGGNIKGLLSEGGAHLSLPTVVQGRDYQVSIPGSRQVARGVFACQGQPLVVTILQADPVGGDAKAMGLPRQVATRHDARGSQTA